LPYLPLEEGGRNILWEGKKKKGPTFPREGGKGMPRLGGEIKKQRSLKDESEER